MTPTVLADFGAHLAGALALPLWRATLEGGWLVLAVAVLTRAFPRLPAATRTALWWLACLRLVTGLVAWPAPAIPLPGLARASSQLTHTALEPARQHFTTDGALAPLTRIARPVDTASPERVIAWSDIARLAGPLGRAVAPGLLALWACGLCAVLAFHLVAARRSRRLWHAAAAFEHPHVRDWLTEWLGARAAARVELRTSAEATAPALLAGRRPRILLPESCAELVPAQLRMVLAHEVAHVRRHDLALGALPALAHALFWFHPFAHWAVEEYALSREEACDADAVRACDAPPHDYGELLLAYGIDRRHAHGAAVSYGSRCASQLHRRLRMLASSTRTTRSQRLLALTVLVVIGLVALRPVRLVAGTAVAPVPVPAAAPVPMAAASDADRQSYSYSYSTGGEHHQREWFAYGYGEGGSPGVLNVSGSFENDEFTQLRSIARKHPDGFGWFRLADQAYLVTEPAALARMRELMAPQQELGRLQGELGDRQGELGELQAGLGERQAELGERQAQLAEQMARLSSELGDLRASAAKRAALQERMDALEKLNDELAAKQDELGKKQSELGARQDELGERQNALGAKQDALAKRVDAGMRMLAEEWVRTGRAVPLDRR